MTTTKSGAQEDGTWKIPTYCVGALSHRVEVLNRRVKKTGGAGLGLETVREENVERTNPENPEGAKLVERWSFVRVTGEVPIINGWAFIARVEHHAEVGNILAKAPGCAEAELPADLRTASATCDHCNAARNRKDTFVLRDAAGSLRRVGRNCLADFLRGTDPEAALRLWSLLSAVRSLLQGAADEGFGRGGGREAFETVGFLACTASAIRAEGWISKAMARDNGKQPTATLAAWIAGRAPRGERAHSIWKSMQPTEADFEEAGEVVAWIEDLAGRTDLNDYLHNLRVAVMLRHVDRKHEGIVASGVPAYRRELEKAAEAARNAAREAERPSAHVGVVDKRYDFRGLTVVKASPVSNDWGTSLMLLLEDQSGNDIKCFLRGDMSFAVGDVLGGKATVKSHEEYKGRKVTMLTRCKLEKGLPVQGVLPVPTVTAAPKAAPSFADSEIPF